MRITHQMLTRNYLKRMNTNLTNLTKSNEKMASQRAFSKGYENVADAGMALKVRRLVITNEQYQTTVKAAMDRASTAEDGLRTVESLMERVTDRMVEAQNGIMEPGDREKIATEIEALQGEIYQIMNSRYADSYTFGASGNADGKPPFSLDATGRLLYQGTVVNDMEKDPATGRPYFTDPGDSVYKPIPYNTDNYVDIGYGFNIVNGKVDPNTGFKNTYSGVESFGYGLSADGVPLNAYELFGKMATDMRNNDLDEMSKDLDAIKGSMDFMLTSITEVGARFVTLEDTQANLENEYVTLADRQNKLEGIDLSEEVMYNKDFEMSWMVTLQLGSRILPQTIFDFMR